MKQIHCGEAKNLGCPYAGKECYERITSIEIRNPDKKILSDPKKFWDYIKKAIYDNSKIWINKGGLYICHSSRGGLSKNFYESEKSELVSKIKKQITTKIINLEIDINKK